MRKQADVHVFITPGGDALPRWTEAFRSVECRELQAAGAEATPPAGVALVWLRLPAQGAPVAAQMAALAPAWRALPLVVLSDLPSDEEALAAFAAGARGYANSHARPQLLKRIAAVVLQGGLWIGESLMQRLVQASARIAEAAPVPQAPAAASWSDALTGRERQVALRVAHGDSNKEVARALGITERTVKAHIGAVLEKLQVRDRLQLSLVVNGRTRPPGA